MPFEHALRRLQGDEAEAVYRQLAEIHRDEIASGFLSTLGVPFLVTLYRTLATSPAAFVFCAEEGGLVTGFIVGSLNTGAVYRDFFRRAGLRSAALLARRVLSWQRVRRVVETLLYPSSRKRDDLPEPEILNFCVRKDWQGKGLGQSLFEALVAEFKSREVQTIRIVTGETQLSAQRFYERRGARLAANLQVHKETDSRVYVYDVP